MYTDSQAPATSYYRYVPIHRHICIYIVGGENQAVMQSASVISLGTTTPSYPRVRSDEIIHEISAKYGNCRYQYMCSGRIRALLYWHRYNWSKITAVERVIKPQITVCCLTCTLLYSLIDVHIAVELLTLLILDGFRKIGYFSIGKNDGMQRSGRNDNVTCTRIQLY